MDRMFAASVGGAAFLFALCAGCNSDRASDMRESAPSRTSSRHSGSMSIPAAMNDGEFAAMMRMHHESAIEMSRYETEEGARDEVRDLARKIADMQTAERPRLERIAREEGHAEHKTDPMMEQRARTDMTSLRAARGAEVDRLFLIHMMDHHAQGVEMARASMPNLRREDLRRMATKMIDDQSREIDQMRAMLDR